MIKEDPDLLVGILFLSAKRDFYCKMRTDMVYCLIGKNKFVFRGGKTNGRNGKKTADGTK